MKKIILLIFAFCYLFAYAQKNNNIVLYRYYNDNINDKRNQTPKLEFSKICKKTENVKKNVFNTSLQFTDTRALNLLIDVGSSVIKDYQVIVSEDTCILIYSIEGTYKGTTVNSIIACQITEIVNSNGSFFVESVDALHCQKK